ncbi:unnamed protein product [Mucor circinelloides]
MPGSPIPPNLNPALPDATGTAHHPLKAPSSDWTSTMTTPGPTTVITNATTSSNKRRRDSMQQDIAGRDCDNNLKQSELIDHLVVKLQEQNLTLARLLERSTLTATTATTTATSSNNNRTKKGSATATKATATTAATNSNTATASSKKKSGNQKSSKAKHLEPPADAAEARKWALRMFTTANTDPSLSTDSQVSTDAAIPPGYTCVYLPISPKLKHAGIRKILDVLKINLKRIFAIQSPAKNIVFLLVHSNYAPEIVKICETDGVNAITDFNPISGKNLGDPKLVNDLTDAQLNDKAKAIYYNRMLQAAVQLRDPRLGLTILKFFNAQDQSSDNHYIPSVIIDEYIKLKPDSVRKISAANIAQSVFKGFDASQLFVPLANTNVDTSITPTTSGSNSLSSSTDASNNAGNSSTMDLNQ